MDHKKKVKPLLQRKQKRVNSDNTYRLSSPDQWNTQVRILISATSPEAAADHFLHP